MKNIRIIQDKLRAIDKKLYIIWGFCREMILWNKNEGDVDIVTDATPTEMKQVLKIVWEVGKKYGTCIVSEGWEAFELTTFRKDIGSINYRKPAEVEFTNSLEEDVQRRDFTCNSIYYNPESSEYIDPTWWTQDIKNGIIRFVWNIEDRIQEDALRILRFIRFKNRYDFKVADEDYWTILRKNIVMYL
jgi:tRNA nucleotidyltransferase (CCA-adding enzyme)